MDTYIVQMAQQALRDLAADGSWKARVNGAFQRLTCAATLDCLVSAPPEVRQALVDLRRVGSTEAFPYVAESVRLTIQKVLEAAGRERSAPIPLGRAAKGDSHT
jgi:hypothetical protein